MKCRLQVILNGRMKKLPLFFFTQEDNLILLYTIYLGFFYFILFHCLSGFFQRKINDIFGIIGVTAVQYSCTSE